MKPWLFASRFPRLPNVGDGGHDKEKEGLYVQREEEGGEHIYVNNFHFPSAAVCITRHGSVVMAIATGQMMQKWVHLVMNLSSADGCLTRVHFETIHNMEPPEGLQHYLKYAAAHVLKVSNFKPDITFIHHVAGLQRVLFNGDM